MEDFYGLQEEYIRQFLSHEGTDPSSIQRFSQCLNKIQ